MATGDPACDVTPPWHLLNRDNRALFRHIVEAEPAETWASLVRSCDSFGTGPTPQEYGTGN
ncbi:MAG: hypothetical protein QOE61_2160 [Micromonosporaceae bacterium]|jgi:hypothetical protein|nr:hypothetical protein [Micromonosporaceae bacterium]